MWRVRGLLLDEASCLWVEEGVRGRRAHGAAWCGKATDVVVDRKAVGRGRRLVGSAPVDWGGGRHRGWIGEGIERQANVSRDYVRRAVSKAVNCDCSVKCSTMLLSAG